MCSEVNPYEAPRETGPVHWLWDRSVLYLLAFCSQFLVLIAYIALEALATFSLGNWLKLIAPAMHFTLGSCTIVAFLTVFALTTSEREWPLQFRCGFLVIELFVVAIVVFASNGFGML